MPLSRRALFVLPALTAHPALAQSNAQTADHPTKAIRIIVPFAPGGSGDITSRLIGKYIEDKTGQPFVVENKPGANGIVGVLAVKAAAPDGYTLMLATTSTNAANIHMFKSPGYDPEKDFSVVGVIGSSGAFLVVPADSPYKTLADLLAYAKANPGKLNFGYFNASSQVPAEVLGKRAGVEWQAVAYRQCLDRPLCRRHPVHVRRPHRRPRPGGGQQGAAAGADAAQPQPALSRLADARRDLPRFHQHGLPRRRRAEGHAASHPAKTEHADQRGDHLARHPEPAGERIRADGQATDLGTVCRPGP
jgi:hypothetical protein